jgi:5-formyltetrahydrofolate cyclo-ligase
LENRNELRKRIRAARRGVAEPTRAQWSSEICQRIAGRNSFQQATKIAGFLAFDGEADPLELMKLALAKQKKVFVPIIVTKAQPLLFAPWDSGTHLQPNRFGIAEPEAAKSDWIPASELDFVITPLVAFDESCNRIGVGGGFYDRSFAFQNENKSSNRVPMVGFAFELQKVRAIDAQPWDVALSEVATESSHYCRQFS